MRNILALLVLLVAVGPCFGADYTVELTGTVYGNDGRSRNTLSDIELTATADPLWGHKTQKELDRTISKTKQDYPAITITGSGKTDATGYFKFDVKVEVPEGKQLPKTNDGGNPPSWYDYIYLTLNCSVDGYRTPGTAVFLYVDKENTPRNIYLERIARITGKLMSLEKMKPLADTTVIIRKKYLLSYTKGEERPTWTVKTDARGVFDLNDPKGPVGPIELELEDGTLAFATTSKAWKQINVGSGDNDLGNLMVVPGCTLKLRVVESVARKTVSIVVELVSSDGGLRQSTPVPSGEYTRAGIPSGVYTVRIVTGAYYGKNFENIELTAGENDLGDIVVDPVLAININLKVDKGEVPTRAAARAILLEGTPPEGAYQRGDFFVRHGQVNGPRGMISQMFNGRWFVEVTVRGWAPFWTEVELPMEGDLDVTLTQGGSFGLTVTSPDGQPASLQWVGVVVPGSIAEDLLRDTERKLSDSMNERAPGLLYSDSGFLAPNPNADASPAYSPGPLQPGKYWLRANTSVGFVEKEFEIKAGEHLLLELSPEAGRLEITVTKDGKPAAGEKLILISHNWPDTRNEILTEARTDANGKYILEANKPASYQVLLEKEKEWVDSAKYPYERKSRLDAMAGRKFHVGYGTVATLSIDSGGRERTWLTVELDLEKGYAVESATLYAKLDRSASGGPHAQGVADGSDIVFAMLRPGEYWLKVTLKTDNNLRMQVGAEVRAEAKAEQTVKVEMNLHEVTVTVKVPRGFDEDAASVSVISKPDVPLLGRFFARATESKKGKYTVPGVPPGEYDVLVTVPGKDGRGTYYGYDEISVKGSTKAKVKIDDDQGSLRLDIRGNSAGMLPGGMQTSARVTLFDKDMNAVTPGYPGSLVGRMGTMTVQGIPSGTYTVRVEVSGCLPWEGEATIEEENTAPVSVDVSPAALVRLRLAPEYLPEVLAQDFTLKLANTTGAEDTGIEVDARNLFVEITENGQVTLYITGVESNVKRLRFALKGYKEAVLDVSVTDGSTFDETLELEKQ